MILISRDSLARTLGALLVAVAGHASANIVANGDFELPLLPDTSPQLYGVGADIGGWLVIGPPGADVAVLNGPYTQFGLTFSHASGRQSLDLTGLTNTVAGVSQALATQVGVTYDLSFHVGNVRSTGIWGTTSAVRVRLDGVPFAVATFSDGPPNTLAWQRFEYRFMATSSQTVLSFTNLDGLFDNVNQIDHVSVTAVVPEPATAALLLGGLALLAWRRNLARRADHPQIPQLDAGE